MLVLTVPAVPSVELWDEKNQRFLNSEPFAGEELLLEHSLASMSKWEEIYEKPFLGKGEKTREETIEYIRCMTIAPVSSPRVYDHLTADNFREIDNYIGRKMTATVINETAKNRNTGEFITAEIIYYWMISLNIPMEWQYKHLNKLITLVRVINLKNQPQKTPRPTKSSLAARRALNQRRRAQLGTTG